MIDSIKYVNFLNYKLKKNKVCFLILSFLFICFILFVSQIFFLQFLLKTFYLKNDLNLTNIDNIISKINKLIISFLVIVFLILFFIIIICIRNKNVLKQNQILLQGLSLQCEVSWKKKDFLIIHQLINEFQDYKIKENLNISWFELIWSSLWFLITKRKTKYKDFLFETMCSKELSETFNLNIVKKVNFSEVLYVNLKRKHKYILICSWISVISFAILINSITSVIVASVCISYLEKISKLEQLYVFRNFETVFICLLVFSFLIFGVIQWQVACTDLIEFYLYSSLIVSYLKFKVDINELENNEQLKKTLFVCINRERGLIFLKKNKYS